MAEPARIIRWEEPPPAKGNASRRRVGSKYDRVAYELTSRPGKSGVIREGLSRASADTLATRIRRGEISCFPRGDFDAVTRTVGPAYTVYARYVGSEEEDIS